MGTLIKDRSRPKKKFKKKAFKPAPVQRRKIPIENWEKLKYEEILAMTPETLKRIKEENPRFIRTYFDNIKKVEWCGFLLEITRKNGKMGLIIQQLGARENQEKTIDIEVTERILIELQGLGEKK